VNIQLNALANTLPPGIYVADVLFVNLTSGLTQVRQVTLKINQNLVHDGGFESDDFCYWTLSGLDASQDNFVDNGASTYYVPHSGDCFAALAEIGSLAYLSQPLPTLAGQLYLISFWLANPSGDTPSQFLVQWNTADSTNTIYNQSNLTAFDWEQVQLAAAATTNWTLLQFGNRDDNYFLGLDDVSVTPIPSPTIEDIQQSGDNLLITWKTLPGLTYHVQFSRTLLNPQWTDIGRAVTASGTTTSVIEAISPIRSGFFRIMLTVPM
jgi:hypothetical protein